MRATSRVMNTIYVEPTQKYPWVGIWNADTTPAGWEEFEGLIMLFIEKGIQVPLFIPRDDIIFCKIGERGCQFMEKHFEPYQGTIQLTIKPNKE